MGRRRNRHTPSLYNGLFNEALRRNRWSAEQYFNQFFELSVSMFEWQKLPDTVDPRFIEWGLFRDGRMIYFNDEVIGNLCLQCSVQGNFDFYHVPKVRRAYAINGYQKQLDDKNSVIIYNNFGRTNSMLPVLNYSERLWNIDRIIDVNVNAQKTPVLLLASEQQRMTMLNLYKEWDGNEPVIFGDKNLDLNEIKSISTGAPYVADQLYTLKTQIYNEALSLLGISNVNFQKKERMVTDEVARQQGGIIANRYSRLEARRQACKKINEMFGTDIWVDFREDYREVDDELMFRGDTEDNTVGQMVQDINTRTPITDIERAKVGVNTQGEKAHE